MATLQRTPVDDDDDDNADVSNSSSSSVLPSSPTRRHRRRSRRKGARPTDPAVPAESPELLAPILRETGCYDDENDVNRHLALATLEAILAQWACTFSKKSLSAATAQSSKPTNSWQKHRVALIPFGSFRLGVHRPSSDLDVLALCPSVCTRNDFFTGLTKLLRDSESVSKVHPIATAYTPVIKFWLCGFPVDLLFARASNPAKLQGFQHPLTSAAAMLQATVSAQHAETVAPNERVPPVRKNNNNNNNNSHHSHYMIDDTDLVDQDEAGVRSLNGARVTQVLMELVPNLQKYQTVLRAVKEWAVVQGIYSNVLGFLGGVNWAILVAWVCMAHPQKDTDQLIRTFFRTFSTWEWPNPVILTKIQDKPPKGTLGMPTWNPKTNPRDGLHVMPIITPCYPSMNSSYNVGIPQLRRMQDEMIRACNALRLDSDLRVLFSPTDFFRQHHHYLQLTIQACTAQEFTEWFRFCELRLRVLITDLETSDVNAWPFGRFFDQSLDETGVQATKGSGKTSAETGMQESSFFIALRFAPHLESVNLRYLTHNFLHAVNGWESRKAGMDLVIEHVTADTLPAFVFEASAAAVPESDDGLVGNDNNAGATIAVTTTATTTVTTPTAPATATYATAVSKPLMPVAVGENQSRILSSQSMHPKRNRRPGTPV